METFTVKETNHLESATNTIKEKTKEKFSKGISEFKMSIELPFGLHPDTVIDSIEESTNLMITRERYSGCGFQYNTDNGKVWTIKVYPKS